MKRLLDKADLVAFVAQATGKARLQLFGRSMRPLLRKGMVVEVEPLGRARRGDILVYRTPRGLVAHRLLRPADGDEFLTCGDAFPERLEVVPRAAVLGRVRAVWFGAAAGARRVDGPLFWLAGRALVALRPLRARYRFAAGPVRVALGRPDPGTPAAFRALVAATLAFEGGEWDAGIDRLTSVPASDLLEVVKRHHASGFVARWLDVAVEAGVPVPGVLHESFRRVRLTSALQADRILLRVRDVCERLRDAGVEAIVLKGGARLAAGEPDADLQFSGDVDVLVPAADADRAVAALHAAGYSETYAARRVAFFKARMHQRAPLFLPGSNVPVEVHVALVAPGKVTNGMPYAALAPFTRTVGGPAGEVRVLDDVASAVHLAYHGRELRIWRDVVLLARKLRAFTPAQRERFDALVHREVRDAVRLCAAVAAARAVAAAAGGVAAQPVKLEAAVARYLSWALAREDMSDLLRRRAHVVEALVARCPVRYQGLWQSYAQALGWLYNLALTPAVVRAARANAQAFGPGAALFDAAYAGRGRPNAASTVAARTQSSAAP